MRLDEGAELGAAWRVHTSLDKSTQLGKSENAEERSGWRLTTYPSCAEASLVWVAPRGERGPRSIAPDGFGYARRLVRAEQEWVSSDGELLLQELVYPEEYLVDDSVLRSSAWERANARAAARSRRYFVANRLRYMWVLTFAEAQSGRSETMALVAEFVRRLRKALAEPGTEAERPIPYWYSPELHPGGHGWHVNCFVAERFEHAWVADLWGHGFVWVVDFCSAAKGPKGEALGLCHTPREGWRRAARYGCKYAQKDWSQEHVGTGSHRYEVGQRFQPVVVGQWVESRAEAEQLVTEQVPLGAQLSVWDSGESERWSGPPVRTWKW